jgi:hypothetical protein
MKLSQEQIQLYVTEYKLNNKLPVRKIPCTVTGNEVTMFGNNLHKRVAKYGGIEELLTSFVSRRAKAKPARKFVVNDPVAVEVEVPATENTPELVAA